MPTIERLHHAMVTVPADAQDAARAFYVGVLGLPEIPKPETLRGRGGFWLQIGDQQVHVGVEDGVQRGGKAHLAYQVDDVEAWRAHLAAQGVSGADNTALPGYARIEFRDPFGNRIELIQPVAARLVAPDVRYQASFAAAVREFQPEGRYVDLNPAQLAQDFAAFVEALRARATHPEPSRVPETILWLVEANEFIGRVGIRHTLNERLRVFGGHIGYEIRPSYRRLGYGTRLLRLALPVAHGLGITRALVTCDATNAASRRIIEANGGVLEDETRVAWQDVPVRRYWIDLSDG